MRMALYASVAAASVLWAVSASAQTPPPSDAAFTPANTWAFEITPDTFSADALLDLRRLNEKTAGEHGMIKLSDDGNSFVRGDGQPIRFWAVTDYVFRKGEPALAEHARFLAKRGVNMVRLHGNFAPDGADSNLSDINKKELDGLFHMVAAMKKEGIYTTLSPIWMSSLKTKKDGKILHPNWGLSEGSDSKDATATGLLFFQPKAQAAYKSWLKQIFTTVNPYTGIALKDDPSVAIFQIQNEDSLLFWTFQRITGNDLDLLRKDFDQWLIKKYGSQEKTQAAWKNAGPDGSSVPDDWAHGMVSFVGLWQLTQPINENDKHWQRYADTTEFLTETMHNWNAEVVRYLRADLGVKALVNAGNWKTASALRMNDLERWSYSSTQVMGVNRYVSGIHKGPRKGYAFTTGDEFTNPSALIDPDMLAVSLKQPVGFPFIVSESGWVPPMNHQSEGPFLVSAMSSLNGVDIFYWFASGTIGFEQPTYINKNLMLGKWSIMPPMTMGQFPAAALMFREGYIEQGQPAVVEHRSLKDLWERRVPIISEEAGFDPNRDEGLMAPRSSVKTQVNRLAYLVGPVQVKFDSDASQTKTIDLSKYINDKTGVVTSDTGQIHWDTREGICQLDTPKAQGVTGFLKKAGGTFKLSDATIASGNDYATVYVVSLDDKPLANSGRILVQAGTSERPTGWKTEPATIKVDDKTTASGAKIVSLGKAPWRIIKNDMTVTVNNSGISKATILDMNGMARGTATLTKTADGVSFHMPADAMYVVLE